MQPTKEEHTKEPWIADSHYVITEGHTPIAYCNHTDAYDGIGAANAKRIVACVNACAGIATGHLEGINAIENPSQTYEELKQRNAELLQVIKDIQQWVRKDEISFETIIGAIDDITEQAIAKATS
jgi:hypothetical protein